MSAVFLAGEGEVWAMEEEITTVAYMTDAVIDVTRLARGNHQSNLMISRCVQLVITGHLDFFHKTNFKINL